MALKTKGGDNILLSKEYLEIMSSTKEKALREKQDELDDALQNMKAMVPDMPGGMFEALFEPLIKSFHDESDIVDFAKAIVYVYRLSQQVKSIQKELTVVDGVLEDVGNLSMASNLDLTDINIEELNDGIE